MSHVEYTTPPDPGYTVEAEPEKPANTPNVVISNPAVRRVLTTVISTAALVVTVVSAVDAAVHEVDWSAYTNPAAGAILAVAAVFGIAVTLPNTPK